MAKQRPFQMTVRQLGSTQRVREMHGKDTWQQFVDHQVSTIKTSQHWSRFTFTPVWKLKKEENKKGEFFGSHVLFGDVNIIFRAQTKPRWGRGCSGGTDIGIPGLGLKGYEKWMSVGNCTTQWARYEPTLTPHRAYLRGKVNPQTNPPLDDIYTNQWKEPSLISSCTIMVAEI